MTTKFRGRLEQILVAPMCPQCGKDREGIFVKGELGELVCRGHAAHPLHPDHHVWLLDRLHDGR